MDIITLAKLKKCISIDMNAGHSFATTTDRDTFFTNNPTQLKADMYIYCNGQLQQYVNSAWEVRSTAIQGSKGDTGISPHIDLTTNNWFIDTVDTGIKAIGTNGNDGTTPHIDETTNNWFIGTTDTGIKAIGLDGVSPHIGVNGNWYIGETDTLVKAIAIDGVGVQTVIDNGDNTFTVTLTNGAFTVIDKIDTINSDVITQGATNLFFTTTEKNKLTSIEENAEVNNISDTNATDLTDNGDTTLHYHASDRDRINHTGVQAISTITGLQTSLDSKTNKDFTTYTQKSTVSSDDKIAINDSEDTNSVKYVTLNQLVSSVQDPHNKGYYSTGEALNTAIPTATDGDFAVVGETDSIWVWSSVASDFVNSGISGVVSTVNGETGIVTLTKTHIGLDNVVNLDTSTTANITDSTDKRFVTDANLVVLGNTSGTNTGDETNETIKTKLGTDLTNKVDKVTGKSLIDDTEITRLSTVMNYDDTAIQAHIADTTIHVTSTEKTTWNNKSNFDGAYASLTGIPTIPDVTNKLEATNLLQGTNVTLTKVGNNVTINATGGGSGVVTWDGITDKPVFKPVATSGAYGDLTDKPDLSSYVDINHVQGATKGGTGQTGYTKGDLLYADSTTTLAKLSAGTTGKVLTAKGVGVAPVWESAGGGSLGVPILFNGTVVCTERNTYYDIATRYPLSNFTGLILLGNILANTLNTQQVTTSVPSICIHVSLNNVSIVNGSANATLYVTRNDLKILSGTAGSSYTFTIIGTI